MSGYDTFIQHCLDQFAFLEARGFVASAPKVYDVQECSLAWVGPDASVSVISEYFEPPDVSVRSGKGAIGLHEALPLLDPDRPTPEGKDALEWVDFQAAFLQEYFDAILDPALLERVEAVRAAEEASWCDDFFGEVKRAFGFLVSEHGYAEPLPARSPTQCSLNYLADPRWVLVWRTEGRGIGVWIDPGTGSGHFGLDNALAVLGVDPVPSDVAGLGAALHAHAETVLQGKDHLVEKIDQRRETGG